MKNLFLVFLLLSAGCTTAQMETWFVPLDQTRRIEKDVQYVAFLEKEPTDRAFKVIGIVAPPDDYFDSYAATINGIRETAGLFGADAVFLISEEEGSKWGVSRSRGEAGSDETHKIRAKAIVWVKQ